MATTSYNFFTNTRFKSKSSTAYPNTKCTIYNIFTNYWFRVCLDTAYFCWNWKYCNEIIFKYVNSAVEPIFNEKVTEKCNLWDPWTMHECTVHRWLVNNCGLKRKKKKRKKERKRKTQEIKCKRQIKLNPNGYLDTLLTSFFFLPITTRRINHL